MTPETIQRLDQLFTSVPVLVAGAVPASEVDRAEQRVGMSFDPDYREFVIRYGGAVVGSLPVLGLRQAEVMADDLCSVVDVTARFRSDGWHATEQWVIVSVDHSGNPIDLAPDGAVWVSDHDAGEITMLAPSFEAFLVRLLDQRSPK